jgi:hypothetical protein
VGLSASSTFPSACTPLNDSPGLDRIPTGAGKGRHKVAGRNLQNIQFFEEGYEILQLLGMKCRVASCESWSRKVKVQFFQMFKFLSKSQDSLARKLQTKE